MSRSLRAALVHASLAPSLGLIFLQARAGAQEPLFTFVQVSDSQPVTSADNQAFIDVLSLIAAAGRPGALLPRPVDLVLFAGDITDGNTRSEWVAAKQKLDTYLTANGIPLLAVPGNHDVNNSDTSLYEEFIADSDVWDAGSAAFTGHNGRSRMTGWLGLRFIGVNNSNPSGNTISAADLAAVSARVTAADAAGENAFILCHHPHNDKSRMPLANVLRNRSLVGYLHGHTGSPHVTKGLAGVVNPVVWDVDTNAIYQDRDLVYFEVFPTQLRAHVVVLDRNPTSLPAAVTMPLAHPLTQVTGTGVGFADGLHTTARARPTSSSPERKLWHRAGTWWGILWSDSAAAYRIQRLDAATQTWTDTGPSVSTAAARSFDALAEGDSVVIAANVATTPGQAANGSPGQVSRFTFSSGPGRYVLDAGYPVTINDSRSPTLVLARDTFGTLWAGWTRGDSVFVAHTLASDAIWSAPLALAGGLGTADTVALASLDGSLGALWSSSASGTLAFARHLDGAADNLWSSEVATADGALLGGAIDLAADGGRAFAAVRATSGALNLFERSSFGDWSVHPLGAVADALDAPLFVVDRAFGLLRLFASGPTLAGQSISGGGALYTKLSPLASIAYPPGRGTPVLTDGAHPSAVFATSTRQAVDASSALVVLGSVAQTARYWHAFEAVTARPLAPAAEFTASPLAGPAPLVVGFTDLSSGEPTYWSWDFGDGSSSNEHEPQHVYALPGTYSVTLRAASGAGEDARTRSGLVVVSAPPPVVTFRPVADARVSESSPGSNAGGDVTLRVKTQSGSSYQSFLRFDLGSLPAPVASAKLRLFCTDESSGGGSVYRIASNAWGETTVTWNNRPALPASALAAFAGVGANVWSELELGPAAVASGLVSLALAGGTTNSAYYSSREGTRPPELVITYSTASSPPVAGFTGSPLSGPAPLSVAFQDTSSGAPNAWSWDFGDGSTSSAQHPSHVYTAPGSYAVRLQASNASGTDALTRAGFVVVGTQPPVTTFLPVADARVNEASPTKNAGADPVLRVRQEAGGSYHTYLRFDLSALSGTVTSARLRLFSTDGSDVAGRVFATSGSWTESTVTWSNKPAPSGALLASLGTVATDAWAEFDLTSALSGPGVLNLVLQSSSSNSCYFSSREGANPPELVVTIAP